MTVGNSKWRNHLTRNCVSQLFPNKIASDWNPLDRISAINAVQNARTKGEILTGLLYMNPEGKDLHDLIETSDKPLNSLTKAELCPCSAILAEINSGLR